MVLEGGKLSACMERGNSNDLGTMPARKRRITRTDLDRVERGAKREAQKAAGALDGRYRPRVVKSKKTYTRKRKHGGRSANGDT